MHIFTTHAGMHSNSTIGVDGGQTAHMLNDNGAGRQAGRQAALFLLSLIVKKKKQ